MPKELKGYELRSVKRPCTGPRYALVSSTVAIRGSDGKGYYCYVSFSDKLVKAVGKKLPRGISNLNPAYLFVGITGQGFAVWAIDTVEDQAEILWTGNGKPPVWLKLFKVKDHDNGKRKDHAAKA